MLMNKVRNVFLIAVIVAAVCAGGRLESVDQAQALGSASAETVESWNAWRRDNPGSVASAFSWADIPACFVEAALDAVDEMTETQGHAPSHVDLLYYRSQEHYDRYGRDKGDYAIVNARSREIADP